MAPFVAYNLTRGSREDPVNLKEENLMKRIALLLATMMAAFALAACSSGAQTQTLEDLVGSDPNFAAEIDSVEADALSSMQGLASDVQCEFKGNTLVCSITLTFALDPSILDPAEFEEAMKQDTSMQDAIAKLAAESGIKAEDIKVQFIVTNPDGSQYCDVTI